MRDRLIYALGGLYAAALLAFTVFVMLDAFVIERTYTTVHDTIPVQASETVDTDKEDD